MTKGIDDIMNDFQEKFKKLKESPPTIRDIINHLLKDPILYISYLAMIIYYLIFPHAHFLTISYGCSAYCGIRNGILNGFDYGLIFMLIFNCYQLLKIFI